MIIISNVLMSRCWTNSIQADGYYGSDIVINEELNYNEGMCTKEFKDCIDLHYDKLMACLSK